MDLNEAGLYKELGVLTKDKSKWEENIPYVLSCRSTECATLWRIVTKI